MPPELDASEFEELPPDDDPFVLVPDPDDELAELAEEELALLVDAVEAAPEVELVEVLALTEALEDDEVAEEARVLDDEDEAPVEEALAVELEVVAALEDDAAPEDDVLAPVLAVELEVGAELEDDEVEAALEDDAVVAAELEVPLVAAVAKVEALVVVAVELAAALLLPLDAVESLEAETLLASPELLDRPPMLEPDADSLDAPEDPEWLELAVEVADVPAVPTAVEAPPDDISPEPVALLLPQPEPRPSRHIPTIAAHHPRRVVMAQAYGEGVRAGTGRVRGFACIGASHLSSESCTVSPAAGSSSAPTLGTTDSADYSFAGSAKPATTWQ